MWNFLSSGGFVLFMLRSKVRQRRLEENEEWGGVEEKKGPPPHPLFKTNRRDYRSIKKNVANRINGVP